MKTAAFLLFVLTVGAQAATPPPPALHWVSTWATSPSIQYADPAQMRTRKLEFVNQTIREIIHTTIGGDSVRIKLSNAYGTVDIPIPAAHIALTAPAGSIVPGSDHVVTFNGRTTGTIQPGAILLSDPIKLPVPVLGDLSISLYFSGTTMTTTYHQAAQQYSYVGAGDLTAAESMPGADKVTSWPFLTSVDVLAPATTSAIVTLGDSITDGAKVTMDSNHRWPDVLASRLVTPAGPNNFSVINAGIGGNKLLTDAAPNNIAYGVNALARLDRDVFAHAGVSHILLYEGINDLGGRATTSDDMIASMKQIIERAHERGIKVIVSTITPSQARAPIDPDNLSPADQRRAAVNDWVRTNKDADGFVDFYKAIVDPEKPGMILAAFDSGDRLHPNEDGLRAMANSIDISLFRAPVSPSATAKAAPASKSAKKPGAR